MPFNYQPMLTGALHKWLGTNQVHGQVSLYSFSWLRGGSYRKNGCAFPNGAHWFVSMHDIELLKQLISGIQTDPHITQELHVTDLTIEDKPEFNTEEFVFSCASPILVKRTVDNQEMHFTYDQIECDRLLTETLQYKLRSAGLDDQGVSVQFDRTYLNAKTKVIRYKNIGNRVNLCPVKIKGTPEQLAFAWDVGVGNSTGVGFGALN